MELKIKNRSLAKNARGYRYLYVPSIAHQFIDFAEKVTITLVENNGKKQLVLEKQEVQ